MNHVKVLGATMSLLYACQLSAMLARPPMSVTRVPNIQKTYVPQRQFIPEMIGAGIGLYIGCSMLTDQAKIRILTDALDDADNAILKALRKSVAGNAQGNISALLSNAPKVTFQSTDDNGNTLLHQAVIVAMWDNEISREKFDHICSFIRACVASGAPLSLQNNLGDTPLHLALIGALHDIHKKTPEQIAQQKKCLEAFGLPELSLLSITDSNEISIGQLLDVYNTTIANMPGINPV